MSLKGNEKNIPHQIEFEQDKVKRKSQDLENIEQVLPLNDIPTTKSDKLKYSTNEVTREDMLKISLYLCIKLINEVDSKIADKQGNTKKVEIIIQKFKNNANYFRDNLKSVKDEKTSWFLRCHLARLNSEYFRRLGDIQNCQDSNREYEKYKAYENLFKLKINNGMIPIGKKNSFFIDLERRTHSLQQILADAILLIKESEFEIENSDGKFNDFILKKLSKMKTDFSIIEEAYTRDIMNQNEKRIISFIRCHSNRLLFLFYQRIHDETNSKVYHRAYLLDQLFEYEFNLKKKIESNLISKNPTLNLLKQHCVKSYLEFIKEADEMLEYAIDFYHAWRFFVTKDCKFKEKWKFLKEKNVLESKPGKTFEISKRYFKSAYENMNIACKIADSVSDFKIMLDCRIKMAGSLALCDDHHKAQIVALASFYLTNNSSLRDNYNEFDVSKAADVYVFIKKNNKDDVIENFLQSNASMKYQLYKQKSPKSYQKILRLNCIEENKSLNPSNELKCHYNEIEEKHKKLILTRNIGYILQALALAVSVLVLLFDATLTPIWIASVVLYFSHKTNPIYKQCDELDKTLRTLSKKLAIQDKLKSIIKRAAEAHNSSNNEKFLEIISEKYDEKSSLFDLKKLQSVGDFNLNIKTIKQVLFENEFRPDVIANFLVMFPDELSIAKSVLEKRSLYASTVELLDSVFSNNTSSNKDINLVMEAIKLDKKITSIKKNIYKNSLSEKFVALNTVEKELMEEARVSSFIFRLNEGQSKATMNKFLFELLDTVDREKSLKDRDEFKYVEESLEHLKILLNKEKNDMSQTNQRFEVFKYFLWAFNFNKELTDLILLEIKDEEFHPNELKIELEKIEFLENEAKKSLPIQMISINLEIYDIYRQIINKDLNLTNEQEKLVIYGCVKCLINFSKFSEATKLLNEFSIGLTLDYDAEFLYLTGLIETKRKFEYRYGLKLMIDAKRMSCKDKDINKEIRKLDKLGKVLNSEDYIVSLSSLMQPAHSVTSISNPKRNIDKKYLILSVDGGGVGGIIPAIWLREIEFETRKPISSLFNMMSGTSAGALITSTLSLPKKINERMPLYSASTCVELFYYKGKKIFENIGREALFRQHFKNYKIEHSLTDLVIPTVQEKHRNKTYLFSTFDANKNVKHNYSYFDMLKSTTFAPVYFNAHHVEENNLGYTIDAALTINNPAEAAYHAAFENYGGNIDGNVTILSLGTGNYISHPYYTEKDEVFCVTKAKACFFWDYHLKDYVFEGDIERDIEKKMGQKLGDQFWRWQVTTENQMKDFEEENLKNLIEVARQKLEDLREDDNNTFNKVIEMLLDDY